MADSMSRPCWSVPSRKGACPPCSHSGGMRLFRSSSWAGSNGSCGESTPASTAATRNSAVTSAATIANFERLKLAQTSLSRRRARQPRGLGAAADAVWIAASAMSGGPADNQAQALIDDGVEDVDYEVDGHEDEPDEHQVGGHDGDVDV